MFSLPSFSLLFALFMDVPLLPAPLPSFTYHIRLLSYTPHPLHDPSHPHAPASSPSPHFRFLKIIYGCSLATSTSPTILHHLSMFLHPPHPLDDPLIPPAPAPACSPASIFAFLAIYGCPPATSTQPSTL